MWLVPFWYCIYKTVFHWNHFSQLIYLLICDECLSYFTITTNSMHLYHLLREWKVRGNTGNTRNVVVRWYMYLNQIHAIMQSHRTLYSHKWNSFLFFSLYINCVNWRNETTKRLRKYNKNSWHSFNILYRLNSL